MSLSRAKYEESQALRPSKNSTNSSKRVSSNPYQAIRDLALKMRSHCRSSEIMNSYGAPMNVKNSPRELPLQRPNKRALLIAVTYYKKRKYRLKGTVNDVKDMRELLINHFHYPDHCIRVLTEFEAQEFHPTKNNIENSLKWLVEGCRAGDSLVFYFSGHGLRQPDFKDDEKDGFDETICPVDFMKEGMILDNDINSTIVRPLTPGVRLHAIVDACHSGTILDLEYIYDRESKQWKDNKAPSGVVKDTSGGLAICLSACEDSQIAADTTVFTGKKMYGALTYILVEGIKKNATYAEMLDVLASTFDEKSSNQVKCFNSRTLARLFGRKITQMPLLSSSSPDFDVNQQINCKSGRRVKFDKTSIAKAKFSNLHLKLITT